MPRRSSGGLIEAISRSSSQIRPEVGSVSRLIIRSVVVFPDPDGPTSTVISPEAASRLSPLTATVPSAYRLVTESKRIITAPHVVRRHQQPSRAQVGESHRYLERFKCRSLTASTRFGTNPAADPAHHTVKLCMWSCPSTCSSGRPRWPPARSPRFPVRRGRAGVGAGLCWFLGWGAVDDGRAPPWRAGPG